jgi:hypothetical protein
VRESRPISPKKSYLLAVALLRNRDGHIHGVHFGYGTHISRGVYDDGVMPGGVFKIADGGMPAQLVNVMRATTVMAPQTIAGRRNVSGQNLARKIIPVAARMVTGHPGFHGYLSRC